MSGLDNALINILGILSIAIFLIVHIIKVGLAIMAICMLWQIIEDLIDYIRERGKKK